jgi:hypothetical protein
MSAGLSPGDGGQRSGVTLLRRWPPAVWVMTFVGSLLILMGLGPWSPAALIAGLVLVISAFVIAMITASTNWGGAKRSKEVAWAIGFLAGFYVVSAAVALAAGPKYAVAALLASAIPLTALALIVATVGAKTRQEGDQRVDTTAGAHDDPFPGIGLDDETPLGDTPEHSDALEGRPTLPPPSERSGSR